MELDSNVFNTTYQWLLCCRSQADCSAHTAAMLLWTRWSSPSAQMVVSSMESGNDSTPEGPDSHCQSPRYAICRRAHTASFTCIATYMHTVPCSAVVGKKPFHIMCPESRLLALCTSFHAGGTAWLTWPWSNFTLLCLAYAWVSAAKVRL